MANVNNHIKNIHVIPEMRHVKGCGGFLPWPPITVSPRFSASQRRQQDFGPRNMAARFFASSCSSAKPKSESLPSQPGGRGPSYSHDIVAPCPRVQKILSISLFDLYIYIYTYKYVLCANKKYIMYIYIHACKKAPMKTNDIAPEILRVESWEKHTSYRFFLRDL